MTWGAGRLAASSRLSSRSQKVRLAATLALSKSKDARAVLAVSGSLTHDDDATIRRVSALALEKMVDAATAEDARELALDALERAAARDRDAKVKSTAADTLKSLAGLRRKRASAMPSVFVNIDGAIDQSRKAPKDAPARVVKIVKRGIERTGYATSWPGGLPTSRELSQNNAQAYIVAANVKKIERAAGDRGLSPAEAYLESLRGVEQCERDVVRIVTTIQEAAKRLERWQAVHVAHAGAGFPKEVTMAGRVIDATTWPTAGQLADTLADWHSAAEAARVAWRHVPDEERSGLPAPP